MMKNRIEIESGRMGNTGGLHITITDDASREVLARIELTPEQAWALTGGTTMHVDAGVSPNLSRVGKTMENWSVTFDSDAFKALQSKEDKQHAAETRAKRNYPDWEEYSARTRNDSSIDVVMYRWA